MELAGVRQGDTQKDGDIVEYVTKMQAAKNENIFCFYERKHR